MFKSIQMFNILFHIVKSTRMFNILFHIVILSYTPLTKVYKSAKLCAEDNYC
jgi:hypothetical protein